MKAELLPRTQTLKQPVPFETAATFHGVKSANFHAGPAARDHKMVSNNGSLHDIFVVRKKSVLVLLSGQCALR